MRLSRVSNGKHYRRIQMKTFIQWSGYFNIASGILMYLLITHDYRLHYVWAYSDNMLEMKYLISTFWGGQEGSFLLWIFFGVLLGLPLMRYAPFTGSARVMMLAASDPASGSVTAMAATISPFRAGLR